MTTDLDIVMAEITESDESGMEDLILHKNEFYMVLPWQFPEDAPFTDSRAYFMWGYAVRNVETGVVEHLCVQLPEAMYVAEKLAQQLIQKPWEWVREVAEKKVNISELLDDPTPPEKPSH